MKTKVSIIVQSHLSDIFELTVANQSPAEILKRIKFVKHLIHLFGNDMKQEIDPEIQWEICFPNELFDLLNFNETLVRPKQTQQQLDKFFETNEPSLYLLRPAH